MKARILILLSGICFSAAGVQAAPSLTLTSNPVNLSNLNVGQSITVQVNLGLGGGPALSLLTSEIDFSQSIFAMPTNITAGPIVPDATNSFLGASFSNAADASFDSTFTIPSGQHIVVGGDFFSFNLTANAPGTGSITFGPASANDTSGGEFDNIGSGSLAYTVVSVPEPGSVLLAIGSTFLLIARPKRPQNLLGGSEGTLATRASS